MAISATEILGTIPLGTLFIVKNVKSGVGPWRGWAYTHEHYSMVYQVPASIWKNDPDSVFALEMYRWSLVLCAFLFFALFGFADEARQHYRRVYTSIVRRIGHSMSILLRSSSQAYVVHSLRESVCLIVTVILILFLGSTSSVPYVKSKGGVTVSIVATGPHGDKPNPSVSPTLTSQKNSILITSDFIDKLDLRVAQYSRYDTVESSFGESFDDTKMHDQSALLAGILPAVPPASIPPHLPDKMNTTLREYSFFEAL